MADAPHVWSLSRCAAELARSANSAGAVPQQPQPDAAASQQSRDEEEDEAAEERAGWSFERQTGGPGPGPGPAWRHVSACAAPRTAATGCTRVCRRGTGLSERALRCCVLAAPAAEALVSELVQKWQKPIDTLSKAGRAFDVRAPTLCQRRTIGGAGVLRRSRADPDWLSAAAVQRPRCCRWHRPPRPTGPFPNGNAGPGVAAGRRPWRRL